LVLRLSRLSSQSPSSPDLYPLSLHDALPISRARSSQGTTSGILRIRLHASSTTCRDCRAALARRIRSIEAAAACRGRTRAAAVEDRKSTRLNSSHSQISYAVFCLKKKKKDES